VGDIDSAFDDSSVPEPSVRSRVVMVVIGVVTLIVFFVVFVSAFHTLSQLMSVTGALGR
jgi:hypothetical protein